LPQNTCATEGEGKSEILSSGSLQAPKILVYKASIIHRCTLDLVFIGSFMWSSFWCFFSQNISYTQSLLGRQFLSLCLDFSEGPRLVLFFLHLSGCIWIILV